MTICDEEARRIAALPAEQRYDYFVNEVADRGEAWGLYDEGWAMAVTDEGQPVFPLWPRREYALLCATDVWDQYQARSILIDKLLNSILPGLEQENSLPGVFFLAQGRGVTPSVGELVNDLRSRLA